MSITRLLGRSRRWRGLHRSGAALISVALAASLGLSACGSSGNELSNIQKTKTLKIGITNFAPQDFQGPNGQWTGYDVDLLKAYAQSHGWNLKIDPLGLDAAVEAVSTHRDDLTIDIFYTAKRAKVIGYSRPMLNYNDGIAVNGTRPTVNAPTSQGMAGKKIGVVTGSAEVAEAQKVPNANVQQIDSISDSFLALSQGRVDAVFQPAPDITWYKRTNPSLDIKPLGLMPPDLSPPITELRGYFGTPKGSYSTSFLSSLNDYLKNVACNGQEQQILNNYGMNDPAYLNGICQASNKASG